MKLLEVFDTPLKWKQDEDAAGQYVADFSINGHDYTVSIEEDKEGSGDYELGFINSATGGTHLFHSDQLTRVLATVMAIMKSFIAKHDVVIHRITFAEQDPRMVGVYDAMAHRMTLPDGWSFSVEGGTSSPAVLVNSVYKR